MGLKKELTGLALIGIVIGTCGVSTMRGTFTRGRFTRMQERLISAIATKKLEPDCICNNRTAEKLKPVIGDKSTKQFITGAKSLVKCYKTEGCIDKGTRKMDQHLMVTAGTLDRDSSKLRKFSYWASLGLLSTLGENASTAKKIDRWYTFTFMFSPGRNSTIGSLTAVFGSEGETAMETIIKECEKK